MGKRDGGGADGDVVGVALDVADEGLVELQGVDGQQLEIAERRIARAEIVDRQAHAEIAQGFELADAGVGVVHGRRFGDFKFEVGARQTVFFQRLRNLRQQDGGVQLMRRQIHGHGHLRDPGVAPCAELAAGLVQHPSAQRQDHSRFLGNGNEQCRRHQPVARMAPAHQCLDPDDAAIPAV